MYELSVRLVVAVGDQAHQLPCDRGLPLVVVAITDEDQFCVGIKGGDQVDGENRNRES